MFNEHKLIVSILFQQSQVVQQAASSYVEEYIKCFVVELI